MAAPVPTRRSMLTVVAANITAVADADPVTGGAQAGWQVDAGAEGTDLLDGVERSTAPERANSCWSATAASPASRPRSTPPRVATPSWSRRDWTLPGRRFRQAADVPGRQCRRQCERRRRRCESGTRGRRPSSMVASPANFRFESGGRHLRRLHLHRQHFDTYVAGRTSRSSTTSSRIRARPCSIARRSRHRDARGQPHHGRDVVCGSSTRCSSPAIGTAPPARRSTLRATCSRVSAGVSGFNLSNVTGTIANNVVDGSPTTASCSRTTPTST